MTLSLEVVVFAEVGESEVEEAINAALAEPPCDWGDWSVRAARIKTVVAEWRNYEDDYEEGSL
jgi:hypothetical protein